MIWILLPYTELLFFIFINNLHPKPGMEWQNRALFARDLNLRGSDFSVKFRQILFNSTIKSILMGVFYLGEGSVALPVLVCNCVI